MKSIAEPAPPMSSPHLMLSTRLVYELGDPHSTLRATTDRRGPAVLIYAGGEIDACNEHTWRHLVSEAANVVIAARTLDRRRHRTGFHGLLRIRGAGRGSRNLRRSRGRTAAGEPGSPIVARIVDACGLSGVLPIYPTADSALAR